MKCSGFRWSERCYGVCLVCVTVLRGLCKSLLIRSPRVQTSLLPLCPSVWRTPPGLTEEGHRWPRLGEVVCVCACVWVCVSEWVCVCACAETVGISCVLHLIPHCFNSLVAQGEDKRWGGVASECACLCVSAHAPVRVCMGWGEDVRKEKWLGTQCQW